MKEQKASSVQTQTKFQDLDLDVGEVVVRKCPSCRQIVGELFPFELNGKRIRVCGVECGISVFHHIFEESIREIKKAEREASKSAASAAPQTTIHRVK